MAQPDRSDATLFPGALAPQSTSARQDRLTFRANRSQGRHGWLRLTPAYSVHVVEDLIRESGPTARVLDPFCGTGTTVLVGAQMGIHADTIDINPFLVWLATAKCASYSPDDLSAASAVLQQALQDMTSGHEDAWTPPIKDIAKWWDAPTLAALARAFATIRAADLSAPARNLLLVMFCRVAIESAAVSFGHQSMSFKSASTAPTLFAETAAERIQTLFRRVEADVVRAAQQPVHADCAHAMLGDSRDVARVLPRTDYTAVITSPPYPNRMSYIRELRPYMYWLGYLETGRQAGELDWQAIGGTWGIATSYLLGWTPERTYEIPDPEFHETIARITARSKVLGTYVTKYFQDVVPHVQSVKRVLAPGASVHYVVGNSKFYEVMLHTERIYAAILRTEGFQDVTITTIRKRTSKKELFEYIVSAHA